MIYLIRSGDACFIGSSQGSIYIRTVFNFSKDYTKLNMRELE